MIWLSFGAILSKQSKLNWHLALGDTNTTRLCCTIVLLVFKVIQGYHYWVIRWTCLKVNCNPKATGDRATWIEHTHTYTLTPGQFLFQIEWFPPWSPTKMKLIGSLWFELSCKQTDRQTGSLQSKKLIAWAGFNKFAPVKKKIVHIRNISIWS